MTGLRQLRSFSTEMMKLAAGVPDAGVRELLAFRRGEEYLPGGQIESNTEEEVRHQAKFAEMFPGSSFARLGLASGGFDLRARKKKDNAYQKTRDYAVTGMKGGLSGLGVMGALNTMRGKKGFSSMMAARRAAAGGASLALVDRAYRHDDLPKTASDIGALGVAPTPSGLKSPGIQLSQARATGLFRGVNHATEGRKPRSLQLGRKF